MIFKNTKVYSCSVLQVKMIYRQNEKKSGTTLQAFCIFLEEKAVSSSLLNYFLFLKTSAGQFNFVVYSIVIPKHLIINDITMH